MSVTIYLINKIAIYYDDGDGNDNLFHNSSDKLLQLAHSNIRISDLAQHAVRKFGQFWYDF